MDVRSETIRDRRGRQFEVEISEGEDYCQFDVLDGDIRIGWAKCLSLENGSFRIGDFEIYADSHYDRCCHPIKRYWLRRRKGRLWHYRGYGLGTALMRLVLNELKQKGVTRVEATVRPESPKESGRLLDWYRSLGFTIRPPADTGIAGAIAEIELAL